MIGKQDILDRAGEWSLRPDVVEKDYILGWLLAALAEHPVVREFWVFKGGTCLKKCFVESYRFSEDLDFSLRLGAPYTADAIRASLVEVAERASELSGVTFLANQVRVDEQRDKLGRRTLQARVYYRGPLGRPAPPQRILLDITTHEPILDGPVLSDVFHPYPDVLPERRIQTYSIEELLAEKTRALHERARPRDLYDVAFLVENRAAEIDLARSRVLFRGKCQAKALEVPTAAALLDRVRHDEELRAEWSNMLAHQLPALPNLDDLLARAPEFLAWIDEVARPARPLISYELAPGEVVFAPAGIQFVGGGSPLEVIRFAGANRLLLEFDYHGRRRLVEPYSHRIPKTGNLLLYAWEIASSQIKAFKVAEIRRAEVTAETFKPRFLVEFSGPIGSTRSVRPL